MPKNIEKYSAFFYIGNSYNIHSYRKFKLPPVYYMRNNGYKFNIVNSSNKSKSAFVFFASSGQVHKGLDLLLEIFSQKDFPCELFICSCVLSEKDFCRCYYKELFHTPNIHTIGFVDVGGEDFWNAVEKCSYVIMPSCSEGIAGSVLICMSAGIIPIVSKECGLEDDEVINLPDCSIDTIQNHILEYSKKSDEWINEKSKRVKDIADSKYSKESFSRVFEQSLLSVIRETK